jgi:hypothetical protein
MKKLNTIGLLGIAVLLCGFTKVPTIVDVECPIKDNGFDYPNKFKIHMDVKKVETTFPEFDEPSSVSSAEITERQVIFTTQRSVADSVHTFDFIIDRVTLKVRRTERVEQSGPPTKQSLSKQVFSCRLVVPEQRQF